MIPRALTAVVLAAAGCSQAKPQPVPIAVGEDTCSDCGMVVADRRYASEIVGSGGHREVFDDLGCLVRRVAGKPLARSDAAYAVDFATGAFVDATAASYVHAPAALTTPMRSGLVAFGERKAAEAAAAEHRGRVLSFAELPEIYRPKRGR